MLFFQPYFNFFTRILPQMQHIPYSKLILRLSNTIDWLSSIYSLECQTLWQKGLCLYLVDFLDSYNSMGKFLCLRYSIFHFWYPHTYYFTLFKTQKVTIHSVRTLNMIVDGKNEEKNHFLNFDNFSYEITDFWEIHFRYFWSYLRNYLTYRDVQYLILIL